MDYFYKENNKNKKGVGSILSKIKKTIENKEGKEKKTIIEGDKTAELTRINNKLDNIDKIVNEHLNDFELLGKAIDEYLLSIKKELKDNINADSKKKIEQINKIQNTLKELENRFNDFEKAVQEVKTIRERDKKNWKILNEWLHNVEDRLKTLEQEKKNNKRRYNEINNKFAGIEKYINTERYKKTIKKETNRENVLYLLKNGLNQPTEIKKEFKGGTKALYETLKRLEKSGEITRRKEGKKVYYEIKKGYNL
ncbi:winged helix-turn-helix domain-containing protein [Methanococcus maripaludis]|uniref:Uncharacterized protein n=1 Tax=Methanococcus maripaludis (strain C5 / ATCC BAA-1333) TaxID=402880 RepID=O06104_METM5|nr:winged helix-turn-helix domain-containing protein [Methanococcus maripaludis]AAC45248.1 unknown [Methanococcus maripaludis C5]